MDGEADSTPHTLTSYIYKILNTALDSGITELDFWNMTLGEITRAIRSYSRVKIYAAKERASFDYVLANLIGVNIARSMSSSVEMPSIEEVYPNLFKKDKAKEKEIAAKDELYAARFRQFANFHNKKYKEVT